VGTQSLLIFDGCKMKAEIHAFNHILHFEKSQRGFLKFWQACIHLLFKPQCSTKKIVLLQKLALVKQKLISHLYGTKKLN